MAVVAEPAVNVGTPAPTALIVEQVPETTVPVSVDTDTTGTETERTRESPGIEQVPDIPEQVQEQEMQRQEMEEEVEDPEMPELVAQDPAETESDNEAEDDDEDGEETPPPRRSARIAGGVLRPGRYAMASTKVLRMEGQDERRNAAIKQAEVAEVELLFVDLQALQPIQPKEMGDVKPLKSHMFSVEKFTAEGEVDKVKSRMVANGNEQDPELYPDKSSPTVAVQSILTCLATAAYDNSYKMAKVDVKGAFVQTEMEGPPVFITCDKRLTKLIVEVLPGLKKYVQKDGVMYCRLLKALYGCVQASKLWFNKLTRVLRREGYEHNPVDPCVMRQIVGERVFLLLLYVDDILILADDMEIDRLEQVFLCEFTWITIERDNKLSYLGMLISLAEGEATVDMTYFVEKLLEGYTNLVMRQTPSNKSIFQVDGGAMVLPEEERKNFHTVVAKLLFLSKRTRPDILTTVSFLCTRVTKATVEDKRKLEYLLGYLQATRQEVLRLKPSGLLKVEAYVEAAFAPHVDSKPHTGVAIFIGGTLVFAASRKQKCVTKSPMESELVALTDNIGFVEIFEEFFGFIINREKRVPPLIYQDSTSVISLVTKGGGIVRTKHLRVRMNLCKEGRRKVIQNRLYSYNKNVGRWADKAFGRKGISRLHESLTWLEEAGIRQLVGVGKYVSSSEVLSYPASTCPNRGLGIVSYAEIKRGVKNILERKEKGKQNYI